MFVDDDRVKLSNGMHARAGQMLAPHGGLGLIASDEIQHRDDGLGASPENDQLIAMLAQHAIASINHVERAVAVEDLRDRLRFLRKAPIGRRGLGASKKAADKVHAIDSPIACKAVEMVEQRDRILQAGCVVELNKRPTLNHKGHALNAASRRRPV
jgi:hypothetical protein